MNNLLLLFSHLNQQMQIRKKTLQNKYKISFLADQKASDGEIKIHQKINFVSPDPRGEGVTSSKLGAGDVSPDF